MHGCLGPACAAACANPNHSNSARLCRLALRPTPVLPRPCCRRAASHSVLHTAEPRARPHGPGYASDRTEGGVCKATAQPSSFTAPAGNRADFAILLVECACLLPFPRSCKVSAEPEGQRGQPTAWSPDHPCGDPGSACGQRDHGPERMHPARLGTGSTAVMSGFAPPREPSPAPSTPPPARASA